MPTAVGPLTLDVPTVLSLLLLVPAIWLYTAHMSSSKFPAPRGARVLLLIAHPDDEAMFFAPTLQALTRPANGNHVKILCLSNGGAAGLGATRAREIRESAVRLGVRDAGDVFVLDDPKLQDGADWSPGYIAEKHLLPAFAPGHTSAKEPTAAVDVLVTFDRHGVSGHANHVACRAAALAWHDALMARHAGAASPVALYTLTSVNVLRKYASAADTLGSVVWAMLRLILAKDKDKRGWRGGGSGTGERGRERAERNERKNLAVDLPSWMLFVAGFGEWTNGLGAMVHAHKSQMVWFRWGWISIGRYMMINELRRIR